VIGLQWIDAVGIVGYMQMLRQLVAGTDFSACGTPWAKLAVPHGFECLPAHRRNEKGNTQ
jgi:hypothetical protein